MPCRPFANVPFSSEHHIDSIDAAKLNEDGCTMLFLVNRPRAGFGSARPEILPSEVNELGKHELAKRFIQARREGEERGREAEVESDGMSAEESSRKIDVAQVKDDLRNAYEKCTDISQESRALIDSFLKESSEKDYELNLSMYGNATKLEKQMDANTHVEPSPYTPNLVTIIPGSAGIVQLSSSTRVEPSPSTPNSVRIILDPAGIVQQVKLLKERDILLGWDGAVMSTQEYIQKVVEDVDEDDDFNSTIPGTIHYKVLDLGSYENDITVGAAMILANVSVFTPKPSQHYLNITMRSDSG
ncbi:hypothetical protein Tco_0111914 [Tanacetum coccineum]